MAATTIPASSMARSSSSRGPLAGASSSSSTALAAAAPTYQRRHSLFGTEDRVVIDIGSRYTKVGFSGEAEPRKVFRTVRGAQRPGVDSCYRSSADIPHGKNKAAAGDDEELDRDDLLWSLDLAKSVSGTERAARKALLRAKLTVLLRRIYHEYLMADPTQRKVILIENPLAPRFIKETIYQVLFENLRAPSISTMSSPLVALFATGSLTGLVVSVGVLETSILPISHGRPLLSHFASTIRGGRRLEKRLRALLIRYGRFIAHQTLGPQTEGKSASAAARATKITANMLRQEVLEEIIERCCFVSDCLPSQTLDASSQAQRGTPAVSRMRRQQLAATDEPGSSPDWLKPHTGDEASICKARKQLLAYDEVEDAELMSKLKERYSSHSAAAGHVLLPLRPPPVDFTLFPTRPATLANLSSRSEDVSEPNSSSLTPGDLLIPGWIRSRVADVYFEEAGQLHPKDGDMDESHSLPLLLLRTLISLPIDLRRPMCSKILLSGGPAALPGFARRLRRETLHRLEEIDSTLASKSDVALNVTRPGVRQVTDRGQTGKRSPLSWPDQCLLSPLRSLLLPESAPSSSSSRKAKLRILNEPPSSFSESTSPNATNEEEEDEDGDGDESDAPICGVPPLLLSWFGASCAGSLKLTSGQVVKRDEWLKEGQGGSRAGQ